MANPLSFFPSIALSAIFCLLCTSNTSHYVYAWEPGYKDGRTSIQEKGIRYIPYSGSISGSFLTNTTGCTASRFGPLETSSLSIGVAGPWDPNPFWFRLSSPSFSNDIIEVYNFETADLICYRRGKLCDWDWGWGGVDWDYHGKLLLDLNRTTIQRYVVDGAEGYQVIGNETSYVGDGVVPNKIGVDVPVCSARPLPDNPSHDFNWYNTGPFSYQLAFTNNTVSMGLTFSTPWGSMELSYTGKRNNSGVGNDTIVLLANKAAKPEFAYLNGSRFQWYNESGHGYGVKVKSMAGLPSQRTEKWLWCSVIIIFVALV